MDSLTKQALIWSLLTVFPVYFLGCAVVGAKKKDLPRWLLYGVAGGVVLMFPTVAVLKGMLKAENTHQGTVAEASAWNRTWVKMPDGARDIEFFEEPGFGYFSAKAEREAFERWTSSMGLVKAERQEWATLNQPSLVAFQARGVDLKGRKLHYEGPGTVALFFLDEGMVYFQTRAL